MAVVDGELPATLPEEKQFADLYVRWYPQFFGAARRQVGADAAHDAIHDVMLKLWQRRKELRPEDRQAAPITTAVRNRAIDMARRDDKSVELTEELAESGAIPLVPPVDQEPPPDLTVVRDGIVAQFTPRCREAYLLVKENGFTYKQAAAAMGIGVESVKTHLSIAHALMERALVKGGYLPASRERMKALKASSEASHA